MIDVSDVKWKKKGKHAFITRDKGVLKEACSWYGRDPEECCIKVFYANPLLAGQVLDDALWGDNRLKESDLRKNTKLIAGTQIQNILWKHGISPRVYGVFEARLGKLRVACQLTEFVKGDATKDIQRCYSMYANVNEMGKEYGFKAWKDITNYEDIIEGKYVDPQPFAFEDKPYLEYVKEIYCEKGKYGKIYYQDEPRIGLTSAPRKSKDRIKYMALDKIDFKDKVVWDIGCAGGYFCRYAAEHGAKRVIGMDMGKPLEAAFQGSNYLRCFNIDYVECDLSRGIPSDIPKADIAFMLSMNYHIPIPERLFEVDTVIFEDNGKESRNDDKLGEPWIKHYKNIEFVGRANDHGSKALYTLRR